jgi:hypothetical protein
VTRVVQAAFTLGAVTRGRATGSHLSVQDNGRTLEALVMPVSQEPGFLLSLKIGDYL